ncbi:MAG TPA: hypothetical protein VGI79_23360 [Caulobacteraceae bacterium]
MSDFSVGEAGVSGLGLIGRRPGAVFLWGLTYLVIYGLPAIGFWLLIMPDFSALTHISPGAAPNDPAVMAMMTRVQLINLPLMVCPMVARALVSSAICRAVLEPEASRFGYLRLGMQELWVGLVTFVLGLLVAVAVLTAIIVLAIPVGAAALILRGTVGPGTWVLIGVIAVSALAGGAIWVALRFCLAVPMSFAAREFRLFESWAATRGRVLPLLGTGLIAMALIWLLEIVVLSVVGAAILIAIGGHWLPNMAALGARSDPAAWLGSLAPWIAVGTALLCLFAGAASAILIAPFATVYRAIAPGLASEAAEARP